MTDTALIQVLARTLKYRELPELVGRVVYIQSVGTIEADIRSILGSAFPNDWRLIGPEPRLAWATVRSHLVLDLTFEASKSLLGTHYESGTPLLKKLGFVVADEVEDTQNESTGETEDLMRLVELTAEFEKGKSVVRLFLQAERDYFPPGIIVDFLGNYPLPRDFVIKDACATNSAFVWFHKHFYIVDQVYLGGL